MQTLSREAVRQLDHRAINEYGIPSLVLMENAGRGATDVLCKVGIQGKVAIVCGKGNNGGDGLVMARHLSLRGYSVEVLAWDVTWSSDAAVQFEITRRSGIPFRLLDSSPSAEQLGESFCNAGCLVDAILGTGATGALREPYACTVEAMNRANGTKFALDIPTGVDSNVGSVQGVAFRADHTCTFVAPKTGMLAPNAKAHVGELHVADIGAPLRLLAEFGLTVNYADRGPGVC